MNNIFPPITLSETEEDQVIRHLSDPAVKKYLTSLAHNKAQQILQMYASEAPEKFLRDVASMQGQLVLLDTLIQIPGAK